MELPALAYCRMQSFLMCDTAEFTSADETALAKWHVPCAGTASLFRNGAFGALVAFGQLTGGLGKGLAVLCMVRSTVHVDCELCSRPLGPPCSKTLHEDVGTAHAIV